MAPIMAVRMAMGMLSVEWVRVILGVSSSPPGARARRAGDLDLHIARRERSPANPRHPQAMLHAQPGQLLLERALRKPEVEQRAQEHVARDPGEEIEVQRSRAVRRGRGAAARAG